MFILCVQCSPAGKAIKSCVKSSNFLNGLSACFNREDQEWAGRENDENYVSKFQTEF